MLLQEWTYLHFEHQGQGKVYLTDPTKPLRFEDVPANPQQHIFFVKNCIEKGIESLTLKEFNDKMRAESRFGDYVKYLKFDARSRSSIQYPRVPTDAETFKFLTRYCNFPYNDNELSRALEELIHQRVTAAKSHYERISETTQIDNIVAIIENISYLVCRELKQYK